MKTMITLLFSALCVATVSAQTDEKDNAMLNNGINFLDIPYVAHTLEVTDGEEELIINCDEVDCTTFVEFTQLLVQFRMRRHVGKRNFLGIWAVSCCYVFQETVTDTIVYPVCNVVQA